MEDKNRGSFSLCRKLSSNWLHPFIENRKFTKYEAWIWMLEQARYFCSEPVLLNDKLIIIPRGYFSTNVEYMAVVFKWHRNTTEKFLRLLEKQGSISRYKIVPKSKRSYTLVKINNYNAYQPVVSHVCTSKYKSRCGLNCTSKGTLYKKDKKGDNVKNVLTYGQFKNIFLSKDEINALEELYGGKYDEAINILSNYIKAKGDKYESHFAVLNQYGWVYKKLMSDVVSKHKEVEDGYTL